ncbi:MAG: cysteate synthase [Rhodothermales bacterium]|nr:cysteate synthase [Rhodothermales bacterium]MBO6779985.1 cysteate synthase [Rhodothermales bacterium]
MAEYALRCLATDARLTDRYTNRYHHRALLRAEYASSTPRTDVESGIWKWGKWLPASRASELSAGTVAYQSEGLAEALGLTNLWITFHGYWPERGGACPTTTFKDLEAVPTLQRLKDHNIPGLICASAGNTARAFAHFGGLADYPILLVVAEQHLKRIWVPEDHPTDSIRLIGVADGHYNDAIDVTGAIMEEGGWRREGGVHNVARRDGIATLMLEMIEKAGRLPHHYFQGVGGGPGPIGVHEMNLRIKNAGLVPGDLPAIHIAQNSAFAPIHHAWQAGRRSFIPEDMPDGDVQVFSDYLVNRTPAYDVIGGLHDVLTVSDGNTYSVSTMEAQEASDMFERLEGIDVLSPAAVALAALRQAIADKRVASDEVILLNVSGGGQERLKREVALRQVQPMTITTKAKAVEAGFAVVRGEA